MNCTALHFSLFCAKYSLGSDIALNSTMRIYDSPYRSKEATNSNFTPSRIQELKGNFEASNSASNLDSRNPENSTQKLEKSLREFVMAGPNDEAESEIGSTFSAGKSFWVKLLEEKEKDLFEEDLKTPFGKRINQSHSNRSPVRDNSAFKNKLKNKLKLASSRRLTSHWNNQSSNQRNESDRRASTGGFGRRSFVDVTNRFASPTPSVTAAQKHSSKISDVIAETPEKVEPINALGMLSTPDIKPSSSRESDVSCFTDILKQWQDKSDDKPNGHFLSPEMKKQFEESLNVPSATKRLINEYDKDYFDHVRERDLINTGYETSDVDFPSSDRHKDALEIMMGKTQRDSKQQLVFRKVEPVSSSREDPTEITHCVCTKSVFSGNDDLASFFLPQLGMACSCGIQNRGLINPEDPTALENVLRPWQVEFLENFGIHRGEQLVKARHRSGGIMAKALRKWRKNKGMLPFKTSSCGMAIDIWAKACKAHVRSVRKQMACGKQHFEREPNVAQEFLHFLNDLPAAPERREAPLVEGPLVDIVPESQVEV